MTKTVLTKTDELELVACLEEENRLKITPIEGNIKLNNEMIGDAFIVENVIFIRQVVPTYYIQMKIEKGAFTTKLMEGGDVYIGNKIKVIKQSLTLQEFDLIENEQLKGKYHIEAEYVRKYRTDLPRKINIEAIFDAKLYVSH